MTNLDDPINEYLLFTALRDYIEPARAFWKNIEQLYIGGPGTYDVLPEHINMEVPPGFMYKVANTPVRSPVKNVQVFPFVPTSYFQLNAVPGGIIKMIHRVCQDNKFTIDEFTIVEKVNLPNTYNCAQILAIVPTQRLQSVDMLGKWVYLNMQEMLALNQGVVLPTVLGKVGKYC